MERWLNIGGYENYQVSTEGRVRRKTTGRILKPILKGPRRKQYYGVLLYRKGGKPKNFYIHLLVKEALKKEEDERSSEIRGDDARADR